MSVSALSTTTATTTTSTTSSTSSTTLFENYEAFLTLLTTQLQNQDPLDPMDTAEFTNQLVQYADVEQAIATNDTLADILSLVSWNTNTLALSYIGKTATYASEYSMLTDGEATWRYDLAEEAENVTITIKDQDGNIVYEGEGDTASGKNTFTWDGKDADGNVLKDGAYSITVEATSAEGTEIEADIYGIGEITNVSTSGDEIVLIVGDLALSISSIVALES
ncbi:flagellar hook assembly protein FlgD [Dongia sp.]|uniref:flagellar hook assembly protein FlgD n=1 Tax=Dongia sp. TaxID=1977262 RepID=UPI0035ADC374